MTCLEKCLTRKNRANEYATTEDFRKIFAEDLDGLYQMAFLLTRDQAKAEQCFVSGLDDAVKANNVFKDWARSWAKRAIIKNAIRALRPQPAISDSFLSIPHKPEPSSASSLEADSVLALDDFQRFVFVMSVLEPYSEQECARLLGCSFREVRAARAQAIRQVGDSLRMIAPVASFQLHETHR